MSLDYTAKVSDVISSLQGSIGMSSKADLVSVVGGTASTTDTMATIITKLQSQTKTGVIITPSTVDQAIPYGRYGGATTDGKVIGDANLVPGNIPSDMSIFGIAGSLKRFQRASSTYFVTISYPGLSTYYTAFNITGLSFNPRQLYVSIKGNYGVNSIGGMMAYGDYDNYSDQTGGYPTLGFDSVVFGANSVSGNIKAATAGSSGGSTTVTFRVILP